MTAKEYMEQARYLDMQIKATHGNFPSKQIINIPFHPV